MNASKPAALPVPFTVSRPCDPMLCPAGNGARCECWDTTVEVDVDELTAAEVLHFLDAGTPEQKAELRAFIGDGPDGEEEDGPGLAWCDPDDVRESRREMAADLRAAGW